VHASIGVAMLEPDAGAEEMLRNADIAMYAAKSAGKRRSELFRPSMHLAARKRLQLSGDLRRAVNEVQFTVLYQPLIALEERRVVGVEALVRWDHPTLGQIPPADFIPLAEETGLIVPIGRFVLMTACRQAKAWHDQRPDQAPFYVSVNVSTRQFRQSGQVVEHVKEATEAAGLDPSHLMLEITESLLMEDRRAVTRELQELAALGVRIAIDDFGTGYSALGYLREFPIDTVKMDRSFVHDLAHGAGDAALVRSVLELGDALGMQIIAEGIENIRQLESLSTLRCETGQGFHFAPPLTAGDFGRLLADEPAKKRA
jgi:EAL domain-containing protein (putative c-di-GMP-specific phosphodiesterase class I)